MGTYCLSGAAIFKAGANVSTDLVETDYDYAIIQAENLINATARHDFSGAFAAMAPSKKYFLEEVCSDIAGMYLIQYDPSKFSSLAEAQTKLDVLRDAVMRGLQKLQESKVKKWLGAI